MNQDESAFIEEGSKGIVRLSESEKDRLSEVLQYLLVHGSLNGLDSNRVSQYQWSRQNIEWLREVGGLAGLEIVMMHEERLIQAFPKSVSMRLKLKQEATLVWLALWYAADVRWRDEGQDQAFLTVAELNDLLQDQLMPDTVGPIAKGVLKDILKQAARYQMIRIELVEPFEESGIEVLPAIRRVLPFRELKEWNEVAQAYGRQEFGESQIEEEEES